MTDFFFEELSEEIHKGVNKKGHPFRYITMATVGNGTVARLRTVVLRQVSKDLRLTIYTDSRTEKINHIKENNQISLLLYHPKKLLQLKIEGIAQLVTDTERLKQYWTGVQPSSRKDYITNQSPGSSINNPEQVEYIEDENYFAMIDIVPSKIEYLKLKRPNHIRVAFKKENSDWNGTFLVP
ncbi:pyridoxamine 5'-phosphate oxidase family protein [Maribacter sp. ACAM166]|uniref:pyridoxamine 5'-phosphate oxidase family protein n=1 Tax=Maribacter sp. ACAM166 TaxID=2508996 RepID=UPI0010FD3759|nr:pyridoxamine 5'-phosphate oxidase family protein [Maribacter sp. ACAM166]TLP81629.1 pyridoxamine 5'-phosphate oxidase [Maribacter sp. ACAM166]